MTFNKAAVAAIAATYLTFSGAAAFAQAGGSDVPSDAKKQGAMENGSSSTGMKSNGSTAKSGEMEKGGAMKKSGDKM